jgi:O-antigen/teichoic acid export membrane protein
MPAAATRVNDDSAELDDWKAMLSPKKGTPAPRAPASVRWKGASHWGLAIFDQAVVSGSRFLISIIVGRVAGPEQLGNYAVAFYVLILLGCIQEALITTPYAICIPPLRPRARGTLLGGVLAMHWLLAGTVIVLGSAVITSLWILAPNHSQLPLIQALTIAAPLSLAWEFCRRMLLAQLRVVQALLLDLSAATLQIAGLLLLARWHRLDDASALAAVGIGGALPAVLAVFGLALQSRPALRVLPLYLARHWRIGKWLMGSQVVRALSGTLPIWITAAIAGGSAVGLLAACANLAALSNPLIFAVANLLTPKAAAAYAQSGVAGINRLIGGAVLAMLCILVPFGLVLATAGNSLLILMSGDKFAGQQAALALLAACPALWGTTSILSCGLAALKQTRAGFTSTLIGTVVTAVLVIALAPAWQVVGSVIGLLVGGLVTCLMTAWQFRQRVCELA